MAKSARTGGDNRASRTANRRRAAQPDEVVPDGLSATADDRGTPASGAGDRRVTRDEIARRAYEIYTTRGRKPGHDIEDWLRAERELRGK